ncbi:MAG: hypothetical protein HN657_05910 [Candidatus Marinimicrobia bacterium]|jgi:predicted dienelactone hydrolase|nr:hypothetical protein [Candidatus Neomarinimicrobiota bacterium]MBT3495821.1 hypothetical protein [Candidatus Neomarinimicrobiota bacterium]MBT3691630.1 hypothetical protein [Candidatus Neomarinimicrobiota bacterium]MBT3731733.1 hypothetical protein [Candidatus Neomarinimicrobiota bacterium]MBT4144889.1 hypothetical protein [Candidatus Neomarinimicrobiota bacterium]
MRLLELIILLFNGGLLYLLFSKKDRVAFLYTLFCLLIVTLIHFYFESSRWQMTLAYFFPVIAYLLHKKNVRKPKKLWLLPMGLWLLVSALLSWLVPVFSLPEPTGSHSIGTETFHWVDSSRLEWFTNEIPDDVRELMVQVWYPTKETQSEKTPYFDFVDQRAETLTKAGGLPSFFANHLDLIQTNAHQKATILSSEAGWPVLIFSHGITGARYLHTSLIENLVSHGFIIFGLDHAYDANITIFPDGHIADYRSDLGGNLDSLLIRKKQMETRTKDLSYIINQIEKMNSGNLSPQFAGKFNLNKIGAIGHSYGGAAVINASVNDARIKACFALDGWINPLPKTTLKSGLDIPFYFMGRPSWKNSDYPNNYELLTELIQNSQSENRFVVLENTGHLTFTDTPLFSPLVRYFLDVGTLDANLSQTIINEQVLGFFRHYLLFSSRIFEISNQSHLSIQTMKLKQ